MIRRRFGIGTLRFRIASGYFLGALLVSSFVAGSTYALTREYLTRQRIDVVLKQSFNSLRFATEYLDRPGARQELDRMAAFLQSRGTTEVLLVGGGLSVASSVSLTPETIPSELIRAVQAGRVGYVIFGQGPRRVAFGSHIPFSGLEAFFVYSIDELDSALSLIARVLIGVVSFAVLVAAVVGARLADRTIEPLARAGEAAQRVSEGLLDTRLEERDRDEVGVLAASFNRMASALQERMVRERRFVSDASHELRTPLTTLKASIDYLAIHGDELPERLRHAADLAASEVRSLQRLVDDLLELSRVEAGAIELASEEIDLSGFAHELVRRRAGPHPVAVSVPENRLVVRTDKMRLQHVVGNLLENAVVHGQRDVQISVDLEGRRPTIRVSDGGPGIPPADIPRIYERFWRADRARHRSGTGGSGLGLAIAKENATLLGAELEVASSNGGTTFTVRLPESCATAVTGGDLIEWPVIDR